MDSSTERNKSNERTGMWRSRWAAFGAAVAISFGGGSLFVAQAAPGPNEATIVNVTPERILDTRNPTNLGLSGPFVAPVSQKLQVTGSIPTATGTKTVVPSGANGVFLNLTGVGSTAGGFVSIRPGDASGAPTTSSLNFTAGATVANAVQVALPTSGPNAGQIDITYALDRAGPTTDLLIDVVGYTTNAGLQQLTADTGPMFATINQGGGIKAGTSSGLVSVDMLSTGIFDLTFDRSVVGCVAVASNHWLQSDSSVAADAAFTDPDKVRVVVRNSFGGLDTFGFNIVVHC